jgi:Arc/MetJ family transcription regulator
MSIKRFEMDAPTAGFAACFHAPQAKRYSWCIEKGGSMSRTNRDLDDRILKKAGKLTHMKIKKEIVNCAMEELVKWLRRKKILELEGKVTGEGDLVEMRRAKI